MPSYDEMTAAARAWAAAFEPNRLTARPARGVVVLACMDARLDLFRLLGLRVGDAHILRNAGGRATDDAIRSIVVSSVMLGTREVVVVHHTGCGLAGVTNDDVRARVEATVGRSAEGIDFLPFADVAESVRDDVARLRACELLPSDLVVWGAVYDVSNGVLTTVEPPA